MRRRGLKAHFRLMAARRDAKKKMRISLEPNTYGNQHRNALPSFSSPRGVPEDWCVKSFPRRLLLLLLPIPNRSDSCQCE